MENREHPVGISIIIPTKNEGKYIGRTIRQYQPYLEKYDLEIIVSDAGSTDDTIEVVEGIRREWQTDRVRYVQRTGPQNIAIGRNAGAAAASHTLLFHTDADVFLPKPVQFFEAILKAFQHPEVVAATTPIWVYPEERIWKDRLYHLLMNALIRLSFFLKVYLAKGECQWVRRSVFERIGGYNEKIIAGEDCNLFYRLHKEGKIAYLYRQAVHHSPRRFRKYGYIGLTMVYLREGLSLLFRGKSWVEEWQQVR
jgi:glycosyltransferase involved in cell wall biosynthesis